MPLYTPQDLASNIAQLIRDFESAAPQLVIGAMIKRTDGALDVEVLAIPITCTRRLKSSVVLGQTEVTTK
jgi:hypothetical protein